METNQTTTLVIKEHDFQEAKNSLKKYTEQAKEEVELSRVPYDGGLFNLGDHKVTGSELNRITSQIQEYLIRFNNLSQGLVDEFGQVYKAFEYLDKDYISGIVASIKAAEEVSKKEQKDRKDIKELVEQHKQSIAVLKKFKADIEKLKHITDIDKVWELLEQQIKLSKELSEKTSVLSKVKHIKDIDIIFSELEKLERDFIKSSQLYTKYAAELKSVSEYCDTLSMIEHIKDIDELWEKSDTTGKNIEIINKSLETQSKAISDLYETLRDMQKTQQQFRENVNQVVSDCREDFSNQIKTLSEAQVVKLNGIESFHTKAVEQLRVEQREQLAAIEKNQNETLASVIKEQSLALSRIEKTQEETLKQLSEKQYSTLEQITIEQSSKLEDVIKSLEEEKTALNEQVSTIAQKAKFAYIVAGGAVVLTIVQMFLTVLGVI